MGHVVVESNETPNQPGKKRRMRVHSFVSYAFVDKYQTTTYGDTQNSTLVTRL